MEPNKDLKSSKVWNQAIHISLSGFEYLYTIGVFNTCQLNVAGTLHWGPNTSYFINLFTTLMAVGQALGCLITGKLMDHYGRRKTMLIIDTLFIISSIILVLPSTVCFGIGRFLVGVSTGIAATHGPVYLVESTPVEMMPKVGPSIYVCSGMGMIAAYGFGLLLPVENIDTDPLSYLWIFMFLFPVIVAVYKLVYFGVWIKHDTPQFYLLKGNKEDAEVALRLTYDERSVCRGLRRVNSEVEGMSLNGNRLGFIGMLRSRKFRKMVRIAIVFPAMQQLCGTTAVFFYSTDIFYKLGGGLFVARVLTLVIGVVNFFSMLSSVWLLPLFGRKRIYVSSQVIVSFLLLLMALFSGYIQADPIIAAVFLVVYFIPSGCGIICIGWMYVTEILNDQIYSFTSTLCFTFAILTSVLFPFSIEYIGIDNTFLVLSGSMACCAVYSMMELIETKDKDKETILIEMKVIQTRVLPRAEDNDSLHSPVECEVDGRGKNEEKGLNSTGFNDGQIVVNE